MPGRRVLYISYNGVTEPITNSQIIPYLRELSRAGHSFDLLTFEKRSSDPRAQERLESVKKELADSGISWRGLRYHKSPSLPATAYDILVGFVYSSYLLMKRRYSMIHARQIVPAAICVVLKFFFGIRWIFDMRGLVAEEYVGHGSWNEGGIKFRLVKWFERKAILSAGHIVVLTERHRQWLLSLPFLKDKDVSVSVIPCCVDMSKFRPIGREGRDRLLQGAGLHDGFVLLYSGSLGTCYFLDRMFEFFKRLKTKIPNASFLFLTDYDSGKIMSEAKKVGVDPSSVKVMFVDPSSVHKWVSAADAGIYFINPYKKFGSCPIKLGEYLACGLPIVINSGIGDSDSLVRDSGTGVVLDGFENGDYDKTVERLLSILKEQGVGQRCNKAAEDYLSLKLGTRRYKDIYERL